MIGLLKYLRANGYKLTSLPAAGRTSFAFREKVYGIPPEQVVGTAGGTKYGYDKNGRPLLTKEPKLF